MWTKRRYPRYKVGSYIDLQGKVTEFPELEKIYQFGRGGCSFLGVSELSKARPGKILHCRFQLASLPSAIHIPGKLIHSTLTDDVLPNTFMFGIEFLSTHQPLIEPIIQKLELEVKAGKISVLHTIDEQDID